MTRKEDGSSKSRARPKSPLKVESLEDEIAVRQAVRERYTKLATAEERCCAPMTMSSCGCGAAYPQAEILSLPAEAVSVSAGCGNPAAIAGLKPGMVVVDLGSGGGIDAFLAAKKVGADEVINSARADAVQAVRGLTNGYGADVVVDAVGGNAPIFNSNVAMAAPGGVVIVIGGYFVPQALDTQDARAREVGIRMSNSYSMWDGVPEFKIALDLLAAGKLRAKEYVTHTFPLDRIAEGFTTADRKAETGAIKVVITP